MDADFSTPSIDGHLYQAKTSELCRTLKKRPRRTKRDWQAPIWKARRAAKAYDPWTSIRRARQASLSRMELAIFGRIMNKRMVRSLYEESQRQMMKKTLGSKAKARLAKLVFTKADEDYLFKGLN